MTNLDDMTVAELLKLKNAVEQAIEKKKEEERSAVIEKIHTLAKEAGFSVEELLSGSSSPKGGRSKTDRRSVVPAKYQDPAGSGKTWSGRGMKPKWVEEALAKGKTLKDLEIV